MIKKNIYCNNFDLLKELMFKLRSLYLFNIYLIYVVWNYVDKKMFVFYENFMKMFIKLWGFWYYCMGIDEKGI